MGAASALPSVLLGGVTGCINTSTDLLCKAKDSGVKQRTAHSVLIYNLWTATEIENQSRISTRLLTGAVDRHSLQLEKNPQKEKVDKAWHKLKVGLAILISSLKYFISGLSGKLYM